MPIYLNRNPRGTLVTRTNECTNPSFETGTAGWQYSWFGNGGNGTNGRATGQTSYVGSCYIMKTWTTAPIDNADAGFQYPSVPWTPGVVKTISAQMATPQNPHRVWVRAYFYDASGNQLQMTAGAVVTTAAGAWKQVSVTASAPSGTDHALLWFSLAGSDTPMQPNETLYLDGVLIETTETVGSYFDGSAGSGVVAGDAVGWTGTAHGSSSVYFIQDPTAVVSPQLINGFDDQVLLPTIVHTLLSGGIAVTQRNMGMRAGTLHMLFATRSAAYQARQGFSKTGTWYLYDSDTIPDTKMLFVVTGQLHLTQSDSRQTWLLDVPFQEVLS